MSSTPPASPRTTIVAAFSGIIALNIAMAVVATAHYPAYWRQPSASLFLIEAIGALLAWALALLLLARAPLPLHIWQLASRFGLLSGALEILNVTLENLAPAFWHGPALSITFMLLPFLLWTTGAALAARSAERRPLRTGILTAILSSGLCMLLSVAAGFLLEFFLAPPSTAAVATWPEFLRSHWTDPRAFALANTCDSAFTHLLIAPIIAAILGSIASWLSSLAAEGSSR